MSEEPYDVVVLGSGPAGLQAAIHAIRRKVSVLVLGRISRSSAYKAHIENYCCIHERLGIDLLEQARLKAEEMEAKFLEEDVTSIKEEEGRFILQVESERSLSAGALVLAMGISRNKLGLKEEKTFLGRGLGR
jgi:thioredoxin reductase (NADPH)